MLSNKIYEIGKNLGLTNKDLEDIISTATPTNNSFPSAFETYKHGGRYGSISIQDIK
jgi:hypothetical protein